MATLTDKQRRFVHEYLIDLNATQAAIRAGYSEKTAEQMGYQLLQKTSVSEYMQQLMAEKDSALIATQDEIMQTLTRVLRREEPESVVVTIKTRRTSFDENGKRVVEESEEAKVVEIPTKVSDVNRSAELLGKRYQMFTDKVSVDGPITVVFTGEDELED